MAPFSGLGLNGKHRVLVIDDHADGADTLAEAVEVFGYAADVAYDGAEGIATLTRFQPHVAIVDVGMPGMDGFEVARRINALAPGVAIIALSGFSAQRHREEAKAAGIAHYLVKPVDVNALLALLKSLCGRL